jgi:hypothetical protein
MTSKRPVEAELKDIYATPSSQLLFTSPCLPFTPHPLYGIVHYAQLPKESSPTIVEPPSIIEKVDEPLSLHSCIINNNLNELEKMLSNTDIILNHSDSVTGLLHLHVAASLGNLAIVKLLIEKGKAPVNITNSENETALMKACLNGHTHTVRYLLQQGADAQLADNQGWTCLHNAASRGHVDIVCLLIVNGEVDCNPTASSGFTPLSKFSFQKKF